MTHPSLPPFPPSFANLFGFLGLPCTVIQVGTHGRIQQHVHRIVSQFNDLRTSFVNAYVESVVANSSLSSQDRNQAIFQLNQWLHVNPDPSVIKCVDLPGGAARLISSAGKAIAYIHESEMPEEPQTESLPYFYAMSAALLN